ncbi:MAG: prephenate dehydratase [Verrucomicrobiota bacterium]
MPPKENKNLNSSERELVELEKEILKLVDRRLSIVKKRAEEQPVPHAEGEDESLVAELNRLLQEVGAEDKTLLSDTAARNIFREIWAAEKSLLTPTTIAFLGPEATFTHQAAVQYFGRSVEYMEQPRIADVFETVSRGKAAYGVVPIENTTEGSVTHTLDMFMDADLRITAEINMPIHHCFLSRHGKDEVDVVYSHTQVFGQCRQWLTKNLPRAKMVELASTTEAAERCAREERAAALASAIAGDKYGLPVKEENIEDYAGNTTRFFVLGKQETPPTGDDKTSLLMVIRDRVGALYDSLLPFRGHGINLSFIQSRPSKQRKWEYCFFVDFAGHRQESHVKEVLEELEEYCRELRILGSYPRARD